MKTIIDEFSVSLDDILISEFRETVSEGSFILNNFSNKDGKNLFNPICSCMDWISVSVRFISNFPELSENLDVKVMQIYSLISAIDIISESVTQLHRILRQGKTWPFKNSSRIFNNKVEHLSHKDDDGYFKEIRSVFGAHPTNLNNNGEKMFASWPTDYSFDGDDFTVSLYSNIPQKPDINFGVKVRELLEFAKERYEYLIVLDSAIVEAYESHRNELSGVIIPIANNIHDELKILLQEVERRQNNEYYRMVVEELVLLFSSDVKEAHLRLEAQRFKDELYPLVSEMRANLQAMNIIDLNSESILCSRLPDRKLEYVLGKMFSWLWSDEHDPLADYYFRQLNEYSKSKYNFNLSDEAGVTLLKLRMMLYLGRADVK